MTFSRLDSEKRYRSTPWSVSFYFGLDRGFLITFKITFAWYEAAGRIVPSCRTVPMINGDISPLACLLTDDGGQDYLCTLPWIDEGLARLDAVTSGMVLEATWGREDWGAIFRLDKALIYSLHDEDVAEGILPSRFRRALVAWRDFLQSPPDVDIEREVEV